MFIYAQATAGTVIVGLFQQQLGDINRESRASRLWLDTILQPWARGRSVRDTPRLGPDVHRARSYRQKKPGALHYSRRGWFRKASTRKPCVKARSPSVWGTI